MTRTWQYEGNDRPGRPLGITEEVTDETTCMAERFVYAGNTGAEKDLNLAGRCVSHYDTVGLMQTSRAAITGVPLSVTRRLLKDADNPDVVADWQGADASAWNDLLNGEAYTTLTTADAAGAVLSTTDAKGNLQRVTYDVAGQLSGSWLTVKGGSEKVILKSLTCSAAGQKLREVHGNGVVTTYTYEAQTQRLTGIRTERPAGHSSGAKVRMLHRESGQPDGIVNDALRYSHDDLIGSSGLEMDGDGNVISMEEYYPYGGTAVWTVRSQMEADYKTVRYSGKERDTTGLYYYGYRYYQPWAGRWLSADPAGTVDGMNLFRMVRNNPVTYIDGSGLAVFERIDAETEERTLNELNQIFDMFLHAALFETAQDNIEKVIYLLFNTNNSKEKIMNSVRKIRDKNHISTAKNTMIYNYNRDEMPSDPKKVRVMDHYLGSEAVALSPKREGYMAEINRELGIDNGIEMIMNSDNLLSKLDLFDTFLHEKTHIAIGTNDHWYEPFVSNEEDGVKVLSALSRGDANFSTIEGAHDIPRKIFTRAPDYKKASKNNADTIRTLIKILAYTTPNDKLKEYACSQGNSADKES